MKRGKVYEKTKNILFDFVQRKLSKLIPFTFSCLIVLRARERTPNTIRGSCCSFQSHFPFSVLYRNFQSWAEHRPTRYRHIWSCKRYHFITSKFYPNFPSLSMQQEIWTFKFFELSTTLDKCITNLANDPISARSGAPFALPYQLEPCVFRSFTNWLWTTCVVVIVSSAWWHEWSAWPLS